MWVVKKKGKENFLTPRNIRISPVRGDKGKKIFSQMGHYQSRTQVKFQTPKVYVGWGEMLKKFFFFFI